MTLGIGFKFTPFQSAVANWGFNTDIYQLGPKK